MNEFVWTFAVASVALIAGYVMCALLSLDTRQKNERAVRRVRGMAEAAIAAHDSLDGTYAAVSAKAILRALEGDNDD